MTRFWAPLLREAVASARGQPVASLLTVIMVAGMCTAVLLTTGRTVAAEQAVLAQLDAAGTRTVVVRARESAGLTTDVLAYLDAVTAVESVTGFGPVVDARNAAVPSGPPVPVRHVYGDLPGQQGRLGGMAARAGAPPPVVGDPQALATATAMRTLGLADGTGGLWTDDGAGVTVVGEVALPDHLAFLDPLVVVPGDGSVPAPITLLVVVATSPPEVAVVEATVRGLLPQVEDNSITVETAAQLAAIRAAVSGELGTHGRATVVGIFAVAALLVAVNLAALVAMRRKDFGRRRALGASRSLIVALLLAQVGLLATVGAVLGTLAPLGWLLTTGGTLPGTSFTAALLVAAILTAAAAAVPPALFAASRDPLDELRVP